jgi:hypothetical protein
MAARKPGRTPGFSMSDEYRKKIQNSKILNYLIDHVEGAREMSQTQVTAGIALLKKCMPDLQATQHSGEIAIGDASQLSDADLAALAAANSRQRAAETARDPSQLN